MKQLDKERQNKTKKRESEKNHVRDKDDYELLQDIIYRPPHASKKFKAANDDKSSRIVFYGDEESSGSSDDGKYFSYKYQREVEDGSDISDYVHEDENYLTYEKGEYEEFEPIILSENYMTENDDRIREMDIPERMQIYEKTTGPPPTDGMSIVEESSWILNQIGTGMVPLFSKKGHELTILLDDIVRFLEFLHVQKLDVPFIAMYRKEECRSLFKDPDSRVDELDLISDPDQKPTLRWHKVHWAILELHRKWFQLQKRKTALQSYYNKRFVEEQSVYDETRLHKVYDSVTKSLKVA